VAHVSDSETAEEEITDAIAAISPPKSSIGSWPVSSGTIYCSGNTRRPGELGGGSGSALRGAEMGFLFLVY